MIISSCTALAVMERGGIVHTEPWDPSVIEVVQFVSFHSILGALPQ